MTAIDFAAFVDELARVSGEKRGILNRRDIECVCFCDKNSDGNLLQPANEMAGLSVYLLVVQFGHHARLSLVPHGIRRSRPVTAGPAKYFRNPMTPPRMAAMWLLCPEGAIAFTPASPSSDLSGGEFIIKCT